MRPHVTALTRTRGAHSTASVCVRLRRPAFAAPYAAVPGDGRRPDTDAMLTMTPPDSCRCMTAFAACARCSGANRLRRTIDSLKRGEAVAASAWGLPPALLIAT